jgi:ABC-type multidrug transport system ATPase subunit
LIELVEVSKQFRVAPGWRRGPGRVQALVDVSTQIGAGEVVAVVGPNGAGKSTLFSIILGFLEPTAGDITIGGEEPRKYIRKHGAGYLPERFRLPPDWRVRDAVRGFASLDRIDAQTGDSAIDAFGLNEHGDKKIAALSHGMLQRVGLAQALMAERMLVILDEPTEGLDAFWRVRFRDTIAQQRARGATVLIASHDLAELERLADRAILLENGRIRETISLRDRTEFRSYRIELLQSHPAFADVFPQSRATDATHVSVVDVSDVADLNRRLAAILAAGATIVSVTPADTLEDRVTRAATPGDA